jgi:hypothetical protein
VVSSRGEQGAVRPAGAAGAAGRRFYCSRGDGWRDRRGAVAVAAAAGAQLWGSMSTAPGFDARMADRWRPASL